MANPLFRIHPLKKKSRCPIHGEPRQSLFFTQTMVYNAHSKRRVTAKDRHFLDVAAKCPEDVKNFIHDLYSPNPTKKLDTGIIEKLRNNIEERLGNLLVTNAQFTLLNPENNPGTTTLLP